MKTCAMSRHISLLHLQSIASDLVPFQNYNKSKDPLIGGCIKQRCEKGYAKVLVLIYNDRGFVDLEFYYIQIMYSLVLIYIVHVVPS